MNQPKPTREQKKAALTKIVQHIMQQKEDEKNLEENKKEDAANKNE